MYTLCDRAGFKKQSLHKIVVFNLIVEQARVFFHTLGGRGTQRVRDVGPLLAQCHRLWPSIKPELAQHLVLADSGEPICLLFSGFVDRVIEINVCDVDKRLTVFLLSVSKYMYEVFSRITSLKPEFTIVIFIHYKPRIAVAILDL